MPHDCPSARCRMRSDTAARRDLARALERIRRLDPRAAELALVELERLRRQAARYRLELRECQALIARITNTHPLFAPTESHNPH